MLFSGLKLSVCLFELHGALGNLFLELIVRLPQRLFTLLQIPKEEFVRRDQAGLDDRSVNKIEGDDL